ncbi:hypothetical protein NliqN6_0255 [Naganishia liquefaciens]|uniref:Chaps-domain-containing protein n=1 Tax=Naganishia liquefaciens TaxID=104408 RepID=A0A8H3TN65_9TREE|nr:hypothetical protein NliqN6_0255 [Naganishia liquefaciens]
MSDLFKDIPEFVEVDIGESLASRTESLSSFRELGPPDLCHVVKTSGSKSAPKDMGSYHYCSGVEASSSASLAAYLNSLTFAVEDTAAWFGGRTSTWKVRSGTYCCFNAFSRVDVRVDVKIPGGVEAYVVDLRGEKREATPAIWQETYLSAILRAIRYADDASYRLAGYRKLDPITSLEGELKFLEAAEALFFKGWQLGSDPEIQVATVISNHLTAGIVKYFGDAFRLEHAANLFSKLVEREPEVAALLAQSLFGMNEEVKAVQILSTALHQNPQSYALLHAQVDFLKSKGRTDWALKLAKQAVNCAPSEFVTWAKLTEVYIDLGEYDSALLTLNSCPMFTFNERDLHRMPTPARTHLPIKPLIAASNILDEDSARDNEADIALLRLPAPGLRGTFARAYDLLTRLVTQVGWDDLLRTRSSVFVMEEEYRKHKTSKSVDGSAGHQTPQTDGQDEASTRAIRSAGTQGEASSGRTGYGDAQLEVSRSPIPTIRISSESDHEREKAASQASNGKVNPPSTIQEESEVAGQGEAEPEVPISHAQTPEPAHTAAETFPEPQHAANGDAKGKQKATLKLEDETAEESELSFSNKRLCERWLDNLFMVLYEDLRVYTIWRAEISHFKTQHMSYRKTGTEWEILGELAQRLHHTEEAKDAFQRCLDSKFSAKAWMKLLEMYSEENDLERALNAAIRLTTYQHRWYMESSYPTEVAHHIYKLGQTHGHAKISYTLMSKNLPTGIMDLMQGYLKYGAEFKVEGYDF